MGGRPKWRRARPDLTSTDLVGRQFARERVDGFWVTDITEHLTREGKVYCTVVLDVCSRASGRVVDIDSSPTAALVTNALGAAIENRRPPAGTIIHSDHGVQFGSWAFITRVKTSGPVPSIDRRLLRRRRHRELLVSHAG